MPAVADIQNTVIREFADHADVHTLLLNQGGFMGEDLAWMQLFWSNLYQRGPVLHDTDGTVGGGTFGQPVTGHPFARAFLIGRDGMVQDVWFGYDPQRAIDGIHALLGTTVPESPPRAGVVVTAAPNPFNPRTVVTVTTDRGGLLDLAVHDVSGRLVRTLAADLRVATGEVRLSWDGRDARGSETAAGVYLVSARLEGVETSLKLVLIR